MTITHPDKSVTDMITKETQKNQRLIKIIQDNCVKELRELVGVDSINAMLSVITARLEDHFSPETAIKLAADITQDISFHMADVMSEIQDNIGKSLQQMSQHFPAQVSKTLTVVHSETPKSIPGTSRRK